MKKLRSVQIHTVNLTYYYAHCESEVSDGAQCECELKYRFFNVNMNLCLKSIKNMNFNIFIKKNFYKKINLNFFHQKKRTKETKKKKRKKKKNSIQGLQQLGMVV